MTGLGRSLYPQWSGCSDVDGWISENKVVQLSSLWKSLPAEVIPLFILAISSASPDIICHLSHCCVPVEECTVETTGT